MSKNADLKNVQERIKHELEVSRYQTLMDIMLFKLKLFVQKRTPRLDEISLWGSAIILTVLMLLLGLLVSWIAGEFQQFRLEIIFLEVLILVLGFIATTASLIIRSATFTIFHNKIIESINSKQDLLDLQQWFGSVSRIRSQFYFCFIFGLVIGIYATIIWRLDKNYFWGFRTSLFVSFVAFQMGAIIYFVPSFVRLAYRLSQYEFDLFKLDPSSSEVIEHISDVLGNAVSLGGLLAALGTLIVAIFGFLQLANIVLIISITWLPLIVLFVFNQYALTRIIRRAKWKTLNEIQVEIKDLIAGSSWTEKEVSESVKRLMDAHDRIKNTANSTLNLRSGLGFINSLLLPILTFLLGNIDTILKYLA